MTESAIDCARAHWAMADATVTLIAARENRVYKVECPSGPAVLRLHRPGYRDIDEIHSELLWMDMLAQQGILVPKPIAAADGTLVQTFDGVVVDMLSWVGGTPLSGRDASEEIYYRLGELMARMHTLADNWAVPAPFKRPSWDLVGEQPSWGRFWDNPLLSAEEATALTEFRDCARLAIASLDRADYGLIHADLVPDNVLCDGDALHPIDFDDGGFGHRLFDVATVTHRSRRTQPDGALAGATLAGYCAHRALDREALALFEALRACSYVGWNICRMHEPGAVERNARFIAEALAAIASFNRT